MEKMSEKRFWGHYFVGAHAIQTVPKHVWMRHCMSIQDIFVLQMRTFKFITNYKNLIAFPRVNSLKVTIKTTNFNIFFIFWFLFPEETKIKNFILQSWYTFDSKTKYENQLGIVHLVCSFIFLIFFWKTNISYPLMCVSGGKKC